MEKLFKLLDFEPHSPDQWAFCSSATRFNIPCCGRRWGKSIAAGRRITYKAFIPDSYIWIVGPTYRLGEKEFRVVFKDIQKLESLGLKGVRKSYAMKQGDMSIRLPWGTVIEVVSAEKADSLVGEGLTHVCMSEAAQHHLSTWEQYIEPALSDRLGSADFPSTPRGYNWYYGMWMMGQDPMESLYQSWRLPTWTNAVRFPGGENNEEIKRIKQIVSNQFFKQEYGAEFTTVVGEIYEDFNRNVHIEPIEYNPNWENYVTMDFGFDNPTVALDIMVDPMENVYVWREYRARYLSSFDNALMIRNREQPEGYHVDMWIGDPRGADEIAVMSPVLGYFIATPVGWKLGIEAVRRHLKVQGDTGRPRLFIDPNCTELIGEMEQLHVKQGRNAQDINEFTSNGNIQHKYNDHGPDALRYFFNERFVVGSGAHLSDVYTPGDFATSEAAEFLKLHRSISLDTSFNASKVLY